MTATEPTKHTLLVAGSVHCTRVHVWSTWVMGVSNGGPCERGLPPSERGLKLVGRYLKFLYQGTFCWHGWRLPHHTSDKHASVLRPLGETSLPITTTIEIDVQLSCAPPSTVGSCAPVLALSKTVLLLLWLQRPDLALTEGTYLAPQASGGRQWLGSALRTGVRRL